ncbi:hypothetical protein GGI25_004541 [Coemansia spiralis]|uniref:Major facilitator superfamily (MFS) profile domain-containing protein n=1 Tax=Coemansia spiralis TaxID=417178 RepID=A0A9W8G6H5_9FUNG|nr:general substrate transporter [Coemansia spiralis]KAJ2620711.1 hypothetical protein GGI26_004789 [Coemansia sp. RSA 1358]KAJ2673974.1 hypothetical protein GGI25_004541 [Coemansia spiralis]
MPTITNVAGLLRSHTTYYVLIITLYGLLYGLDTASAAATLSLIKDRFKLNPLQLEYIGASTSLGAIPGLLIVIAIGSRCSRKAILLVDSIAYVVGFALVGAATNFTIYIAGRTILGVAHGVSTMIVPVYVGEISPKELRGLFITFNTAALNLGLPIGFALSMLLELKVDSSRWVFIVNGALSLAFAILIVIFVPNSPRDLIFRGKLEKAQLVIQKLNYPNAFSQDDAAKEVHVLAKNFDEDSKPKFKDLFSAGNLRALTISCVLQIAKQSSGFSALQYFSGYLFKLAGLSHGKILGQLPNLLLGSVQFIMAFGSLMTIDRLGRRKLLLVSSLAMAVGLIALGGSFVAITGFEQINKSQCEEYTRCGSCVLDSACGWAAEMGKCMIMQYSSDANTMVLSGSCHLHSTRDHVGSWLAVVSLILSLGAFALGLGSIPWVIQAEMFSQALRSKAGSVAAIVNWLFSYIWTVSFLQLAYVITLPVIFWLYATLLVSILFSVYWAIPETTGRTLEDIVDGISNEADHSTLDS